MDLSICVPSFNTREALKRTLAAAIADGSGLEAEWIVVDNASRDGSAAMVRREFPQTRLVQNAENRFYAAATNQGLAMSKGSYVLLLNSDAEVLPGTLGPLVDYLRSHPDLGAVTTRMYDPDGGLQRNCSRFPAFRMLLLDYTFLGRLLVGQRRRLRQWAWYEGWDRTTERDVDVAPGSFLLARRAALGAVGGFDERFRLYFTEDDWCRRLRDAGYGVRYVPLGGVVHPEGTSVKTVPKMARRIYFDDLDRFTAKYYGRPRATVLSILALPTRWRRSTAGGQGA